MTEAPRPANDDPGFMVAYPEFGDITLAACGGVVALVVPRKEAKGGWEIIAARRAMAGASRYVAQTEKDLAQIIAAEFAGDLSGLEWFTMEAGDNALRRIERPAGLPVAALGPVWVRDASEGE